MAVSSYIKAFSRCFLSKVNYQLHQGQMPLYTKVAARIPTHNFQATSMLSRFLNHYTTITLKSSSVIKSHVAKIQNIP